VIIGSLKEDKVIEMSAIATGFATVMIELILESSAVFVSSLLLTAGIMYLLVKWDDKRK